MQIPGDKLSRYLLKRGQSIELSKDLTYPNCTKQDSTVQEIVDNVEKEFENTKGVIKICKWKDRQCSKRV